MKYTDLVVVSEGVMTLDEFARQRKAALEIMSPNKEAKSFYDANAAYTQAANKALETGNWKPALAANKKVIKALKDLLEKAKKIPDGDWGDVVYNAVTMTNLVTLPVSIKYKENPIKNGNRALTISCITNELKNAEKITEELEKKDRESRNRK